MKSLFKVEHPAKFAGSRFPDLSAAFKAAGRGNARASVFRMAERLLVLEDNDQLATVYKEYLTERGYQVDCAVELEEAESLLSHFSYSLVITDLRLSKLGFGGLDFIRRIREVSSQIRIIVLTGYTWPEIEDEVLAHKVDAFLRKPIRLQELAETIAMALGVAA